MEIYQLQRLIKKISYAIWKYEEGIVHEKGWRDNFLIDKTSSNRNIRKFKKELAKLVDIQKALKKDLSAQIEAIRYNSIVGKFRKQLENS